MTIRAGLRTTLQVAAAAIGAACIAACTLALGKSGHQCDSDSECLALGGDFASSRCTAARVCEPVTLPQVNADSGTSACATNEECTTQVGGPARCIASQCVALRSEDCTSVPGSDYRSENTVYLGVIAPLKGPFIATGTTFVLSAYTAAQAVNANTADVSKAKKIVVIGCDETADPARAARHLIERAKVSGIIGPFTDQAYEAVLPVTRTAKVPLFAPLNDNPTYGASANSDGFAWSCSPNRSGLLPFFNRAVEEVGKALVARNGEQTRKVFLAVSKEPSSTAFADALEGVLSFNGKSAANNRTDGNFNRTNFDFNPNIAANFGGVVGDIVATKPNIIVLTSAYAAEGFVDAVEAAWQGGNRPFYLLYRTSPSVARKSQSAGNADRKQRVLALDWTRSTTAKTNAARFVGAYTSTNNGAPGWLAEGSYDCSFGFVYGAFGAVGRAGASYTSINGVQMRKGIELISAGTTQKNIGPEDARSIVDGLLNTSDTFRVAGASSDLNFDLDRGSPSSGGTLHCVDSTGAWRETGITFPAGQDTQTGVFACP